MVNVLFSDVKLCSADEKQVLTTYKQQKSRAGIVVPARLSFLSFHANYIGNKAPTEKAMPRFFADSLPMASATRLENPRM